MYSCHRLTAPLGAYPQQSQSVSDYCCIHHLPGTGSYGPHGVELHRARLARVANAEGSLSRREPFSGETAAALLAAVCFFGRYQRVVAVTISNEFRPAS